MSDLAQKTAPQNRTLKPREALIIGRIESVRRNENNFYTSVICPAEDVYSKPEVLELRSSQRIGSPQDEVRVFVKVGGFQFKRRFTDDKTGEVKTSNYQQHYLDVIE